MSPLIKKNMKPIEWNEYEIELEAIKSPGYDEVNDTFGQNHPYFFRGKTKKDALFIVKDSLGYIGLDQLKKRGQTRIGKMTTRGDRVFCRISSPLPLDVIRADCIEMYGDMASDGCMEGDLQIFGDGSEFQVNFIAVKEC